MLPRWCPSQSVDGSGTGEGTIGSFVGGVLSTGPTRDEPEQGEGMIGRSFVGGLVSTGATELIVIGDETEKGEGRVGLFA